MNSQDTIPQWLAWAREIQALAQSGNHYALNEFQTGRYQRLSAIAAEMIATHADVPVEPLTQDFQAQLGYATPRVDVRAAVFNKGGQILLVKDWQDKTWSMPGGWADVGDVPSQSAERETREEAGVEVRASKVLGVYDANRFPGKLDVYHAYKLVYLCDLLGGELRTSNETLAVDFFSKDNIPLELGPRTTSHQLQHAFEMYENSALPTFFD